MTATETHSDVSAGPSYRWPLYLAVTGIVVMLPLLILASVNGEFFTEGRMLLDMPWGLVTLADIYTGLLLLCSWIIMRERDLRVALSWCLALLLLGNLASCLYLLRCLCQSGGNLQRLYLGRQASMPVTGGKPGPRGR